MTRRGRPAPDAPPGKGLSRRVVRSGAWLLAVRVTGRAVEVVRLVILARLLSPADFGTFGLAAIAVNWTSLFARGGAEIVLMRRRERAPALYDTAWTLNVIRRSALAVAIVVLAPALTRFLDAPEVTPFVRAMALIPVLRALRNVGLIELRRELMVGPELMMGTAAQLTEVAVSVAVAVWIGNAWALVAGAVSEAFVQMGVSYLRNAYRPSLRLGRAELRELVQFGRWELGSGLLTWVRGNGPTLAIGKLLGLEPLGLYRVARRVAVNTTAQVGDVMTKATLAAYVKLQDSPERLRRAYLRVLCASALAAVPVSAAIATFGVELVGIVLGPRWTQGASIVPFLAVCGLAEVLKDSTASFFRGTGRPQLHMVTVGIEVALLAVLLVPLAAWLGLPGVVLTVAAAAAVATGTAVWRVARGLGIAPRDLARVLGGPFLASLALPAVRHGAPAGLIATLPGLLAALVVAAVLYGAVILLLARLGAYPLATAVPLALQRWLPRGTRLDIARPDDPPSDP